MSPFERATAMVGTKRGMLTIVGVPQKTAVPTFKVAVRCDCGTEKLTALYNIELGKAKSCGCQKNKPRAWRKAGPSQGTFDGKPCRVCGSTTRYRSCGRCTQCRSEKERGREGSRRLPTKVARSLRITRDDRDRMLAAQGGRCAICRSAEPNHQFGWAIDHDHLTNKVRGILCPSCNIGLGCFKDSPLRLRRAIQYLANPAAQVANETPADGSTDPIFQIGLVTP